MDAPALSAGSRRGWLGADIRSDIASGIKAKESCAELSKYDVFM